MGYHRAGFDVVGVDVDPQPRYPFEFHQADAMTYPLDGFDAIHASPPCQAYSALAALTKKNHPRLIEPTRARLIAIGVPYVIENVMGAPLIAPVRLCGSSMGLPLLRRHRLFESNFVLLGPACNHTAAGEKRFPALNGNDRKRGGRSSICGVYGNGGDKRADLWPEAMGIERMTRYELTQAIPPAYTEWIGRQLLAALERAA